MNRVLKNIFGVTLLEIMLVLAIAAMIIVMSIRYYQASNSSNGANSTMEQINVIASAVDNISRGGGGNYSNVTQTALLGVVGSSNMMAYTNLAITFSATGPATYNVVMPLSNPICANVAAKLVGNSKIGTTASCDANATLYYTYNNAN